MADIDGLDRKPWQQMSGESDKAHHAFRHFLYILPHERSMDRAYTQHQRICKHNPSLNDKSSLGCPPGWQEWRFRFSWLERANAHDVELAERDRLRRIHEIDQMNHRHTQIAVALQNLVVERLQAVVKTGETFKLTPTQMAALLDRAALVERRSRGEPTSIVRHQGDSSGGMALDLSKLTDQELELFQQLVAKAEPAKVEVES